MSHCAVLWNVNIDVNITYILSLLFIFSKCLISVHNHSNVVYKKKHGYSYSCVTNIYLLISVQDTDTKHTLCSQRSLLLIYIVIRLTETTDQCVYTFFVSHTSLCLQPFDICHSSTKHVAEMFKWIMIWSLWVDQDILALLQFVIFCFLIVSWRLHSKSTDKHIHTSA